ncbi:hypothetical protein IC582_013318 [Cucumis melo]
MQRKRGKVESGDGKKVGKRSARTDVSFLFFTPTPSFMHVFTPIMSFFSFFFFTKIAITSKILTNIVPHKIIYKYNDVCYD